MWYANTVCFPWHSKVHIIWIWCSVWSKRSRFPGGLASLGVLSCGLARTGKIAFSIYLPVFSCIVVDVQMILSRSPDTLSMKFYSSCIILLNYCRMIMDWSCRCTSWLWYEHSVVWLTNGILLYFGCLHLSLICPSQAFNNVTIVIVINTLIAGSLVIGNGTMWADWSSHNNQICDWVSLDVVSCLSHKSPFVVELFVFECHLCSKWRLIASPRFLSHGSLLSLWLLCVPPVVINSVWLNICTTFLSALSKASPLSVSRLEKDLGEIALTNASVLWLIRGGRLRVFFCLKFVLYMLSYGGSM